MIEEAGMAGHWDRSGWAMLGILTVLVTVLVFVLILPWVL